MMVTDDDFDRRLKVLTENLAALQDNVEKILKRNDLLEKQQRHSFSSRVAFSVLLVIFIILWIIFTSIWFRYSLARDRLRQNNQTVQTNPATGKLEPVVPAVPNATLNPAPSAAEPQQAAHVIADDFVERNSTPNGQGNSYSLSLDGLKGCIESLAKTGAIPVQTASAMVSELTKNVIQTTSEVTKEVAKALIAKYLSPIPAPKENAGVPAQQVQVFVYERERSVTPAAGARTKIIPKRPVACVPGTATLKPAPEQCPTV